MNSEELQLEKAATFYNDLFSYASWYNAPYSESRYFPLWTAIYSKICGYCHVLDLGCGPGQFARFLYDAEFLAYTGIDFSLVAIGKSKLLCPRFKFELKNIYDCDFHAYSCDVIVALETLEHLSNDLDIITRLPPGIRFIASVPNFMCDGHVRCFPSREAVTTRYESFFKDFSVLSIPLQGAVYHIFDGVRK